MTFPKALRTDRLCQCGREMIYVGREGSIECPLRRTALGHDSATAPEASEPKVRREMIHWPSDTDGTFWTVETRAEGYTPVAGPYRMFREHFDVLDALVRGVGDLAPGTPTSRLKRAAGLQPGGMGYIGTLSALEERLLIETDGKGGWRITEAGRTALLLRK